MGRNINRRSFIILLICIAVLVTVSGTGDAAKKKVSQQYVLTAAELQLELMSYADRYAATVVQASEDVERLEFSAGGAARRRRRRGLLSGGSLYHRRGFRSAARSARHGGHDHTGPDGLPGILAGASRRRHRAHDRGIREAGARYLERRIADSRFPTARGAAGKDRTVSRRTTRSSAPSAICVLPTSPPNGPIRPFKRRNREASFHRSRTSPSRWSRPGSWPRGPSSCRPGCRCSPADLPTSGSPD